jgi:mRNA interferase YafQ
MFEIVTSTKFLKDLNYLRNVQVKIFNYYKILFLFFRKEVTKASIKNITLTNSVEITKGYWECHVKPDLLLIWDENEQINLLELVRTGTHSDLF